MQPFSLIPPALALCLCCLLGPSLCAEDALRQDPATSNVIPSDVVLPPESPVRDDEVNQDILDAAIEEVHDRLQMSAPMELEYEDGVDPVVEAFDLGLIVEVSLEQVEAALAAAALTPEIEDDQAALLLKHRGSYRYFCGEITMEPTPPEDPPSIEPDLTANPSN